MTDSPRPGHVGPHQSLPRYPYQAYPDPAYAGSAPLGPSYAPTSMPSNPAPTQPLPQYWTQTYPQTGSMPPVDLPPEPPRGPRPWLWAMRGLLRRGGHRAGHLGGVRQHQSVAAGDVDSGDAPVEHQPHTAAHHDDDARAAVDPAHSPTDTDASELRPPARITSGETEPVLYEVTGEGRAINITYIDNGGVMQTEFNVLLPWQKDVDLPKPAKDSASITVINAGRNVTCKISIGGVQVQERTGALLTVCSPSG